MKFSQRAANLTTGGKTGWEVHFEAQARLHAGGDIILLSQGDHPFNSDDRIVAAAKASLDAGHHHYAPLIGDKRLRSAIAARAQGVHGVSTTAENVALCAGAQGSLFSACACVLDPGDEAILIAPHYATYPGTIRAVGAVPVMAKADADRGFALDLGAIRAAISPRTRAVVINTPNNPTGAVYGADELAGLLAIAAAHDLWVISDEVYHSMAHDGPHVSPRSLPGGAERVIALDSLSKSHAMTGWRQGWAIGPAGLAQHIENLSLCTVYGLPAFAQEGARAALGLTEIPAKIAALYKRKRDLFLQALGEPKGVRAVRPAGGMVVMLDVRGAGGDDDALAWALLNETGVAALPGGAFGPGAEGFLRLALVADDEALREAAARINRFFADLQG